MQRGRRERISPQHDVRSCCGKCCCLVFWECVRSCQLACPILQHLGTILCAHVVSVFSGPVMGRRTNTAPKRLASSSSLLPHGRTQFPQDKFATRRVEKKRRFARSYIRLYTHACSMSISLSDKQVAGTPSYCKPIHLLRTSALSSGSKLPRRTSLQSPLYPPSTNLQPSASIQPRC